MGEILGGRGSTRPASDTKLSLERPPPLLLGAPPWPTSASRQQSVCPQRRNPGRTGRRQKEEAARGAARVRDQPARKRSANFCAAPAAGTAGYPAAAAGMQITRGGSPIIGRDGQGLHQ